jgi:hypothetical protein
MRPSSYSAARETTDLDATAARKWRCAECGAMASGEQCANGHPAPWTTKGRVPPRDTGPAHGVVARQRALPANEGATMSGGAIRIERGVPIPPKGHGALYPWGEMGVGDSFFVPCGADKAKSKGNSIATAGRLFLRRNGVPEAATTSRTVEGGIRIWRIK